MKVNSIPQNMVTFVEEHHVMSLATTLGDKVSACSVYYVFMPDEGCFVFASNFETEHIEFILQHPEVAGTIHEEQRDISVIKGLQIKGMVEQGHSRHEHAYVHAFPEAQVMKKEIWVLKPTQLKYTDNHDIGFGQKLIWQV